MVKSLNPESYSPFPTSVDKLRLNCDFTVTRPLENFRVLTERDLARPSKSSYKKRNNQKYRKHKRYNVTLYTIENALEGSLVESYPLNLEVKGVLALWRDDYIRVRISQPISGVGAVSCWINFNPAKLVHGNNTTALTAEELRGALLEVERRLYAQGVVVSVMDATISQLDIYRDIDLPRPVRSYLSLLHRLEGSYCSINRNFPSGLWRSNASNMICIYDKNWERQRKAYIGEEETVRQERAARPNRMRIEWRMLNSTSSKYNLEFKTPEELVTNYSILPSLLDRKIKRVLLREPIPTGKLVNGVPKLEGSTRSDERQLRLTPARESDMKKMLMVYGYDRMVSDLGFERVNALFWLRFAGKKSPGARSKIYKSLRESRLKYSIASNGVPYAQLYAEILRAFFGERR